MMKLVNVKCPNCGANLNISSESKKIMCEYCRQMIFVEETDATYKLKVSGNIGIDGIETDLDLITAANELMDMGEYLKAKKKFLEFSEKCPEKYQGWLGLLICRTRNFTIRDNNILFENDIKKYYEHFLRTATDDVKSEYSEVIDNYMFPERARMKEEEMYNSISNKMMEKNNSEKKTYDNTLMLDLLKYIMAFFSILIVLGGMLDGMVLTTIFWIINFLIFLPQTRDMLVNKYPKLKNNIIIISIIIPILAIIVLVIEVPELYEDTWVSSNGMTVNLDDGVGTIVLSNGNEFSANYVDTIDSSGNYLISIIDDDSNVEYTFKYEDNNDIITFCLIENGECSLYFKPSNPSSSYEYNY